MELHQGWHQGYLAHEFYFKQADSEQGQPDYLDQQHYCLHL
jgi:hypothetical protein